MMDISTLYNKYEFLGNEFLTWLLFMVENHETDLEDINGKNTSVEIGNRIVMKNFNDNISKTVTIKSSYGWLEEAIIFLRAGALVSEINLIYSNNDKDWSFALKGKDLSFISLKLPASTEARKDTERFFLEKVALYDEIIFKLDGLFEYFIKIRVSTKWVNETVESIKLWMNSK